jgi:hypothetical protein
MDEMYRLAGACHAYNQSGPAAQIWVLCKNLELLVKAKNARKLLHSATQKQQAVAA